MQVVSSNQTPAAEESQPGRMPVRLHPADAMALITHLASTPGSTVDLDDQKWMPTKEDFDFRASKACGIGMGVYKIQGTGERSHARLALHGDGTWEIWTEIDV